MEETRPMHKMIPEEEFAAFLEVHPPKMLLSQVGYAYCAEGMHVAEREARLKPRFACPGSAGTARVRSAKPTGREGRLRAHARNRLRFAKSTALCAACGQRPLRGRCPI